MDSAQTAAGSRTHMHTRAWQKRCLASSLACMVMWAYAHTWHRITSCVLTWAYAHVALAHLHGGGRVHVEDGVVEVRVRVGPCPRAQQPLPLPGPQEGDVLQQVSEALLILLLVHRTNVELEVGLEPDG